MQKAKAIGKELLGGEIIFIDGKVSAITDKLTPNYSQDAARLARDLFRVLFEAARVPKYDEKTEEGKAFAELARFLNERQTTITIDVRDTKQVGIGQTQSVFFHLPNFIVRMDLFIPDRGEPIVTFERTRTNDGQSFR